ncbi:MAG: 8-amino-7-oxononanoate synthase [Planctomycetaceae bacterium]|nr:8-amino-7-oxononanoate synthase [Planctomycetaceae bacterium]
MPWREQLIQQHRSRVTANTWRERQATQDAVGRELKVNGKTYLNFCSNDYLGLANHPALAAAATDTIQKRGTGAAASHLICGHQDIHQQLENELAAFVGAEKAIAFSTGYMANLAVPQTFLERGDLVLQDRLNHASLIDAGRFCEANLKRYRHLDFAHAQTILLKSNANKKLLTTDGVFSMDGDQAPLHELTEICRQTETLLLIDDAHGFGVLGETGAGSLEQHGIGVGGGVLMLGTLGKAAGSFGAFIAGDAVYIDSLIQRARSYIYTTALPPSIAAATRAAIQIFQTEPERREKLNANIHYFRQAVGDLPLKLLDSKTAIQPILLGDSETALKVTSLLQQHGLWITAIRPPTVPEGTARIRITISCEHHQSDLDQLIAALSSDAMRTLTETDQ